MAGGDFLQFFPHAVLILHIGEVQRLHFHGGENRSNTVGVVGVEMGQRHCFETVEAHGREPVHGVSSRVNVPVGAAAVHQHGLVFREEHHALPLSYIQRRHVDVPCAVVEGVDENGKNQHQHRGGGSNEIFPFAPTFHKIAQDEACVGTHQPNPQQGVGEIHRVVAPAGQQIGNVQHGMNEPEADPAHQTGKGQPQEAQQHRNERGHKAIACQGHGN